MRLARQSHVAEGPAWASLALAGVAATGGLAVAAVYWDNAAMLHKAQAVAVVLVEVRAGGAVDAPIALDFAAVVL